MIFNPLDKYTVNTFSNVNTYESKVKSNQVITPFGKFDSNGIEDGNDVEVLIRDQAFSVTDATTNNSYIVRQIDFTGEKSRMQLSAIDSEDVIKIMIPGKSSIKLNDKIGLSVDNRYVHIFN